jgi:hypothetical protein
MLETLLHDICRKVLLSFSYGIDDLLGFSFKWGRKRNCMVQDQVNIEDVAEC